MIAALHLRDIAQAAAGVLQGADAVIERINTDSRAIKPGDVFVALKGERFDGHDFVADVVKAGAIAVVVSAKQNVDVAQIVVDDTLLALGFIARINRRNFKGKLVALTGSAGKTTTKDMIASVLSQTGSVLATSGNLNNEIGVPLTLLSILASHRFAVIEMGAGKTGDIAYLMQFVEPDVALLTNAAAAHIKGFGSELAVAQTKGEIFSAAPADAITVTNLDSPYAGLWQTMIGSHRQIGFGIDGVDIQNARAAVRADNVESKAWGSRFSLYINNDVQTIELQVPGLHNIANALATAAVAHALGLPLQTIKTGLEQFSGSKARLQRKTGISGCTLIDDTYNANPSSMASAIAVLASQPAPRVLVMGDMAELGTLSDDEHCRLLELAEASTIETIYLHGEQFARAAQAARRARHFANKAEIAAVLKPQLTGAHSVLVKGSRSMRMEMVVDALAEGNVLPIYKENEKEGEA
jgi:UDP-N-acetylmuramoyl-tripeptide--D-alanyl-D-alanine ligase